MGKKFIIANDNFADLDRYWNGCGWTERKKNARKYGECEIWDVLDQMFKAKVPAREVRVN